MDEKLAFQVLWDTPIETLRASVLRDPVAKRHRSFIQGASHLQLAEAILRRQRMRDESAMRDELLSDS